jgi:hypothetical protein
MNRTLKIQKQKIQNKEREQERKENIQIVT